MKKAILISLVFISFWTLNISAQSLTLIEEKDISILLQKYIRYFDLNPIWQEDADRVNDFIDQILTENIDNINQDVYRSKAFELLYDNTTNIFEDSADVRRMYKRKLNCYLAISLLSDEYRYEPFLNDARSCVSELEADVNKELAIINLVAMLKILKDENKASHEKMFEIQKIIKTIRTAEIEDKTFVTDVDKTFLKWEL